MDVMGTSMPDMAFAGGLMPGEIAIGRCIMLGAMPIGRVSWDAEEMLPSGRQ